MQRKLASGCASAAAPSVLLPIVGMPLHDLEFFFSKRTGLEQDAVGNAHLADVVQRAGHIEQLNVVAVDLISIFLLRRKMLGDHAAILADAFQVRARVLIARLGEFRQAEDDHFAAFERQDAAARVNADVEFLRFKRFRDEVVGAGVQALDDVLRSAPRGQQNDVDVSAGSSARGCVGTTRFPSSPASPSRERPGDRRRSVSVPAPRIRLRRGHLMSEPRKRIRQHVRGDIIIIDDQDAQMLLTPKLPRCSCRAAVLPHCA